jgi:hypothetical protein
MSSRLSKGIGYPRFEAIALLTKLDKQITNAKQTIDRINGTVLCNLRVLISLKDSRTSARAEDGSETVPVSIRASVFGCAEEFAVHGDKGSHGSDSRISVSVTAEAEDAFIPARIITARQRHGRQPDGLAAVVDLPFDTNPRESAISLPTEQLANATAQKTDTAVPDALPEKAEMGERIAVIRRIPSSECNTIETLLTISGRRGPNSPRRNSRVSGHPGAISLR